MTSDYISCELVYGDFRVVAFISILSQDVYSEGEDSESNEDSV
jgi:hypothetical protein